MRFVRKYCGDDAMEGSYSTEKMYVLGTLLKDNIMPRRKLCRSEGRAGP